MMTINLFIHLRNGKNDFFPISYGWEKKTYIEKRFYIKEFFKNPFLPFFPFPITTLFMTGGNTMSIRLFGNHVQFNCRNDRRWKQINDFVVKQLPMYCDSSRIVKVYDLRTLCEAKILDKVIIQDMARALMENGYPVWYTDYAWYTLLRPFPSGRNVPRLHCTNGTDA